jgi:hypothetical protein
MYKFRLKYTNELRYRIKTLEKENERLEYKIKNHKSIYPGNNDKQGELKCELEKNCMEIDLLVKKISDYMCGNLDNEISLELEKNSIKKERKIESKKKVESKHSYSNYDERNYKRDCEYYYNQYMRAVDTLPDYMRRNLREMPGNKGYVWKNCWFFGEKRREKGPVIMFEKCRDGLLRIHESFNNYYRVYEKEKDGKRMLVEQKKK